jgi:hypothetical protein
MTTTPQEPLEDPQVVPSGQPEGPGPITSPEDPRNDPQTQPDPGP